MEEESGNLRTLIQHEFLLPDVLARYRLFSVPQLYFPPSKYAHIIFINNNRLDTSKRKLSSFTFPDFEYCASIFMRYWSSVGGVDTTDEFDQILVQDVRDLKSILLPNKDLIESYRTIVFPLLEQNPLVPEASVRVKEQVSLPSFVRFNFLSSLMDGGGSNGSFSAPTNTPGNIASRDFQTQFRLILRNIIQIGSGLTVPKEVRDLFLDIVEMLVEPCVSGCGWRAFEIDAFFDALEVAWEPLAHSNPTLRKFSPSWKRLLFGMRKVVVRLCSNGSCPS